VSSKLYPQSSSHMSAREVDKVMLQYHLCMYNLLLEKIPGFCSDIKRFA
jgi:hypothetical protein